MDACWHFAGFVGVLPEDLQLRQLWRMASGRQRERRFELVALTSLVWGMHEIDVDAYLLSGMMSETGAGGPVKLSPEMQAAVDAKVEQIRRENPNLPKFKGMQ